MKRLLIGLVYATILLTITSCEDDISPIGSSLTNGEVTIVVDSLPTNINGSSEWVGDYDSRTITKLLGKLSVPEYGDLSCSFVTQFMSATAMHIPDSITTDSIDGMKLILKVLRGNLTGDSLSPQQLKVYRLPDQLPDTISSSFNPREYYSAMGKELIPYGTRSYTLSNISLNDSAFKKSTHINIDIPFYDQSGSPTAFAKDLFKEYRDNNSMFGWPDKFNKWFPGIYIEQNFGNGCVGCITQVEGYLYWHHLKRVTVEVDSNSVDYRDEIVRDSVCLLASKPEVVSSNNITYIPSPVLTNMADEGKSVVTTPGGYVTNILFPIERLINRYEEEDAQLSVVAGLSMEIPARLINNDYGLVQAPSLLMVKKSERENFFIENRIPDNITSFTANFDNDTGTYKFEKLRNYFLSVMADVKSGKQLTREDFEFTLIPVTVTSETVDQYGTSTTYVLRCSRYMDTPTMTELDTENTIVNFAFSAQELE